MKHLTIQIQADTAVLIGKGIFVRPTVYNDQGEVIFL